MAVYPPSVLGSVSEAFYDRLARYCAENPDGAIAPDALSQDVSASAKKGKKGGKGAGKGKKGAGSGLVDASTFKTLMSLKFMRTQTAAGEAVGVIAGQSVGEWGGWASFWGMIYRIIVGVLASRRLCACVGEQGISIQREWGSRESPSKV